MYSFEVSLHSRDTSFKLSYLILMLCTAQTYTILLFNSKQPWQNLMSFDVVVFTRKKLNRKEPEVTITYVELIIGRNFS